MEMGRRPYGLLCLDVRADAVFGENTLVPEPAASLSPIRKADAPVEE